MKKAVSVTQRQLVIITNFAHVADRIVFERSDGTRVRSNFCPNYDIYMKCLYCRGVQTALQHLAGVQVSWLRRDTTQILAAGSYTYVNNHRYTAAHLQDSDTWQLRQPHFTLASCAQSTCM